MKILGLDFGTVTTIISYIDKTEINFIVDDNNNYIINSIIGITNFGILIGNQVKNLDKNDIICIENIKRFIGKSYHEILMDECLSQYYDLLETNNDEIYINTKFGKYTILELLVRLFRYLKNIIDRQLGDNEEYKLILTIPVYFGDKQRNILLIAAKIVDLNIINFINEPSAGILAYTYDINSACICKHKTNDDKILALDFGGGTIDLSICAISDDNEQLFQIIGTYGDNKFGGIDITKSIYNYIKNKYSFDDDNKLLDIAEILKLQTNKTIEYKDTKIRLETEEFNKIINEYEYKLLSIFDNFKNILYESLDETFDELNIQKICLIGGSTQFNWFKSLVKEYFSKEVLICDNTKIKDFITVVSCGATIYGNFFCSNNQNNKLILIDVLPLAIGLDTVNGYVPIIPANSMLPVNRTQQFTTEEDNQDEVIISIYQGNSKFTTDNILIGEFKLENIYKAPKGVPVINVTISIDKNGILSVTATDRKKFTYNNLVIENTKYKLSDEQISDILKRTESRSEMEKELYLVINKYNNLINIINRLHYNVYDNTLLELNDDMIKEIEDNIFCKLYEINNTILGYKLPIKLYYVEHLTIANKDNNVTNKELTIDVIRKLILSIIDLINLINDKYQPFITYYDNTYNDTYDKSTDYVDIEDKPNEDFNITEMYEKQLYEETYDNLLELIKNLYINCNNNLLPINNPSKLTNYLDNIVNKISIGVNIENKSNIKDKINISILEQYIKDINDYCEYLVNEQDNIEL